MITSWHHRGESRLQQEATSVLAQLASQRPAWRWGWRNSGVMMKFDSLKTCRQNFTIFSIRHGSTSTTLIWWAWQPTTCQVFTPWPPHLLCLTGAGKPCWHFDKVLSVCNCICHCVCVSIENRKTELWFLWARRTKTRTENKDKNSLTRKVKQRSVWPRFSAFLLLAHKH